MKAAAGCVLERGDSANY